MIFRWWKAHDFPAGMQIFFGENQKKTGHVLYDAYRLSRVFLQSWRHQTGIATYHPVSVSNINFVF